MCRKPRSVRLRRSHVSGAYTRAVKTIGFAVDTTSISIARPLPPRAPCKGWIDGRRPLLRRAGDELTSFGGTRIIRPWH